MLNSFFGRPTPRPVTVPWKIRDAIIVFLVAWVGVEVLLILGIRALAPSFSWAHTLLRDFASGNIYASFGAYLISALVGLGLVLFLVRHYGARISDLGLRKFNFLQALTLIIAIYIGFTIAVGILFAVLSALVPAFNATQPQTNDFTQPSSALALRFSLVALVMVPAFLEEVVFRGFMFPAMSTKWGIRIGAVVSSGLFALAHEQWNAIVYTFILGLLLCWMYRRLGSIWPGMVLHALNNYIAFAALLHNK